MKDIHFKVDDDLYAEWQSIGKAWFGIRSHLMRRKTREVVEELKKSPMLQKKEEAKGGPTSEKP